MSDQNFDTSRTPSTNKNPLLSASVTGLTFDDFTNKAIILPAAALPPKLPEPKDTEPTKPVIFGTEPAILDTESFSEISLDQPSDHETYPSIANPLQDDQFNADYSKPFNPLTQATQLTASLSQLPSVASSVFSSFSNILRGNSPTPNISNDQPQVDTFNVLPVQSLENVPSINSSLTYQSEEPEVPAVVPTFYSTSDPAFLPPGPALSPPPLNTSSGNAYRLTTKRKTYAPAPGLSHQENQAIPSAFPSQGPPLPHPINEPNFQVNQPTTYQNTATNQPPIRNSKFSLTSLFSTPLLEKITGPSVSHTQETPAPAVPDVFAVQSTNPPAPISVVNPALFDTHTVPENIPTYSPQQQAFQPPLFFNPAQQTSLPTDNQPVSASNISSIPPSTTIQSSGNVSNYRLRGKPHYKNPLSSTTIPTPLVTPFLQATPSSAPIVGIFNPVNLNISSDQQVQSVSSAVYPDQSSSGFTQQLPNVAFFNQPQSAPFATQALPFTPFHSNNPGNATSNFGLFGTENVQQQGVQLSQTQEIETPKSHLQPIPHQEPFQLQPFQVQTPSEPQQGQSQITQQNEPFQVQPFQIATEPQPGQVQAVQQQNQFQLPSEPQQAQLQAVQQQSFQLQPCQQHPNQLNAIYQGQQQGVEGPLELGKQSTTTQYPVLSSSPHQAQLPLSNQASHLESNLFQKLEPVTEPSQLQQNFQQQAEQKQLSSEQSFFNPFAVPTSHSQNVDPSSNFTSGIFAQFQPPNQGSDFYPPQTSSTVSAELNPYPREEVIGQVDQNTFQFQYTEEISENTLTQLTELNLTAQETSGEGESQQQITETVTLNQQTDAAGGSDSKTSTTFDNFFNRQTSQQSFPDPPLPEPASNLASAFFTTSSNSSATDWFNPSKTVEQPTNQFASDINRNTQTVPGAPIVDASNFFTTNNNQTTSPPNYFQIQNFFNNPPLISDTKEQDNNFNFIENNLINKRLHNLTHKASTETDGGSISSNIVEPPSSAQSEFSEFAEINPETAQSDEYLGEQPQFPVDSPNTTNMANASDQSNGGPTAAEITNIVYRPVYKHWFYNKKSSDQKPTWTPFPMNDSLNLEDAFTSNSSQCITTNGGRYDCNIERRTRSPVYWNGTEDEVRRCSWFYKGADSRLVPYEESVADLLEEEYRMTSQSGEWNRRIVIPSGEIVLFQAPSIMVHFLAAQTSDIWPNASVPATASRPRVVKRGVDEFNIEDGEPEQINHLLFMVHGIGAGCDLRFRSVEEVVEDFRSIALQLTQSHYRSSCDRGEVGRIEVLPVSWHTELHSEESGIDEKLKAITLESIPKLRTFTNDTLLDILFYSSPVFCQKIMDTVAGTINKMYIKYCERNPNFKGNVSLAGHSLGSLILFDLLQNQKGAQCFDNQMDVDSSTVPETNEDVAGVRSHKPLSRTRSKRINYTIGPAGTGQPFINYPQLVFHPKKFFALGSPIGMFVTVRGVDNLGLNYKLPTTDGFYNIFHPYDPVAYRIEALVNSELIPLRPVLIPHHKGRKRMHLELRETMVRVGADIKQKIIDTFKSVYNFASLQKSDPKTLQQEVDKVLEQQLSLETSHPQRTRAFSTSTTSSDDNGDTEFSLGMLNEGKRIDYVLQEAPLEFFNEYLFALTSHVCYWDSADTILFIVKEIYTSLGMQTDSQIPQQSMTIERPISTPTSPAPSDS